MKKLIWILAVFVVALLASACETTKSVPPPPPSAVAPADERYYCTFPESDTGKNWKGNTQVCYDTQVYTLQVEVLGDMSSNQTVSGSFSGSSMNGTGFSSGRMWTDGKGILPVNILSINPQPDSSFGNWLDISLPYILKTTDLGLLGVPVGAIVTVICNHDVEVLSPVFNGQTFTKDRITNELDVCRMVTKNFVPGN